MHKTLWSAAVLFACALCLVPGAAEAAGACEATPENARYQLDKAAGDAAQALKDWLHYCPNEDRMVRYAEELQKAKGAPVQKSSPPPAAAAPKPAPRNTSEPIGTFAQSGRLNYDDRSGYFDWDDTLVIREDGTAEMKTRYKVTLNRGWHLTGCQEGMMQGVEVVTQKYTVTLSGSTVTLDPRGPSERARVEPACWEARNDADDASKPWILEWSGGHLRNKDGEYFRQD